MTQAIASKNIDGIADLVIVAPIKKGFIEAYENITYATRLKVVAEALTRHGLTTPSIKLRSEERRVGKEC